MSDDLGEHSLSCGIGGERIARHNHIREAIFQTTVQAGLGPVHQPEGLLEGSVDRPADLFLHAWSNGKDNCMDFTCTNACQSTLVTGCATNGAHAVEHANDLNTRKYEERCQAKGLEFMPIVVNTLGSGHPKALDITMLGRQIAWNVGRQGGEVVRQCLGHPPGAGQHGCDVLLHAHL